MIQNPVAIEVAGIRWSPNGRDVLRSIDLAFEPGRVHVLAGPNGAGKTSLFKVLVGTIAPDAGAVVIGGRPLQALDPVARASLVAAHLDLPHDAFGFTVRELVAMGRHPHVARHGRWTSADDEAVAEALGAFDLTGLVDARWAVLSAGQQQRVGLARTLAQGTPVLLLDEPLARLDPLHVEKVLGRLRTLADAGHTVVAVIHEPELAARVADRLVLMRDGGVVADGPPRTILTPATMAGVWGVRARIVEVVDDDGRTREVIVTTGVI
jgi:iron complex transport system ATP-binding protein